MTTGRAVAVAAPPLHDRVTATSRYEKFCCEARDVARFGVLDATDVLGERRHFGECPMMREGR